MIHVGPALIASSPAPTPAAAPARALIEAQLAMLSRLAEIGMGIAEAVGRQAADAPPEAGPDATPQGPAPRDPGLVFARVARAVRMTIALQSRLAKDLAALDRADDLARMARTTQRRMRLHRLVAAAVEDGFAARREAGLRSWDEDDIEDEIEQLTSEAYERLTDAEDGYLAGRPFGEVVAGVCADLGLSPDWTARLLASVAAPPEACGDAPAVLRPEGQLRPEDPEGPEGPEDPGFRAAPPPGPDPP